MILVAGLSPAWQQIIQFSRLNLGEVNRADSVHWCASGKVLNVGIALRHLIPKSESELLPHVLSAGGGWSGQSIQQELSQHSLSFDWIDDPTPTRVCTTVLDAEQNLTTELVENSAALAASTIQQFVERFQRLAAQAEFVVLAGSLPAGLPDSFYAELLQHVSVPVLLDFRGPALHQCLPHRPFVVKPNREELASTVGYAIENDDALTRAMQEVADAGAQHVVVSDGPQRLFALSPGGMQSFVPPQAAKVVNPIGCGDCLAAGIALGLTLSKSIEESIQIGLQAAKDNVEQLLPARCHPIAWPDA
ncbi:MAG: bifunctional hydroxymethylpyrimidine kinase/phosphomethylpyrimidine kinase [Planctomycetaceae bacterium]|nr:bifunctional hydroxymethylpyrimidine kinase/phosphomethylpyrimidine kinase [Planctomycetaceae bacterium]